MLSLDSKFFLFVLSGRRNFIPILSVFFLTLDNTNANQIGIFTALGFLGTFLFEIPSGYFSDLFGHKKTLLLAKVIQGLSVLLYIAGAFVSSPFNFYIFTLGAVFQSIGFAFTSGTISAFYHDILESKGEESKFAVLFGKIKANVSLFSVLIIIALPFLVNISYLIPLIIGFGFDIMGFFALLFIKTPNKENNIESQKTIFEIFKDVKVSGILGVSIFFSLIGGYLLADSPYRGPYLVDLGYPVILIGFTMGLSRVIWFLVGHHIHILEKYFSFKKLMLFEIFFFSGGLILISVLNNPYLVGVMFSILVGYKWGRGPLVTGFLLKEYVKDKNYKATFLSITSQLTSIVGILITYFKGLVIFTYSYKISYFFLGLSLFLFLLLSYGFIFYKKR